MTRKVCAFCTILISGDRFSPIVDYGICRECLIRRLGPDRVEAWSDAERALGEGRTRCGSSPSTAWEGSGGGDDLKTPGRSK